MVQGTDYYDKKKYGLIKYSNARCNFNKIVSFYKSPVTSEIFPSLLSLTLFTIQQFKYL